MSAKDSDPKSLKKKLIQQRNKRDLRIWKHLKEHHEEEHRVAHEEQQREEQRQRSRVESPGEEVWSAKTQELRNKLTGKKRKADDRWNRFAGTSGGGGKGR